MRKNLTQNQKKNRGEFKSRKNRNLNSPSDILMTELPGSAGIRYLYIKRRMLPLGVLLKGSYRSSKPLTCE